MCLRKSSVDKRFSLSVTRNALPKTTSHMWDVFTYPSPEKWARKHFASAVATTSNYPCQISPRPLLCACEEWEMGADLAWIRRAFFCKSALPPRSEQATIERWSGRFRRFLYTPEVQTRVSELVQFGGGYTHTESRIVVLSLSHGSILGPHVQPILQTRRRSMFTYVLTYAHAPSRLLSLRVVSIVDAAPFCRGHYAISRSRRPADRMQANPSDAFEKKL